VEQEEAELELLLSFDGASYEAAAGYVVEFMVNELSERQRDRTA
jgi:hypothetical protein